MQLHKTLLSASKVESYPKMRFNGFTRSHFRLRSLNDYHSDWEVAHGLVSSRLDAQVRAFLVTALLLWNPISLRRSRHKGAVCLYPKMERLLEAFSTEHREMTELPLFPFSSTAAKSTPFSKRTEQMVGRSCWAARWRAVWRCLVNSFTLAPARSCWSWLHEQPLYYNQTRFHLRGPSLPVFYTIWPAGKAGSLRSSQTLLVRCKLAKPVPRAN